MRKRRNAKRYDRGAEQPQQQWRDAEYADLKGDGSSWMRTGDGHRWYAVSDELYDGFLFDHEDSAGVQP